MPKRLRSAILAVTILLAASLPAAAQGAPAVEVRLAVVDMDRVMAESDMGKAEQASLDKLKNDRTALINARQKELDSLEEQIRNASLAWSDEKRETTVREYETKRIELRRLNEDATRDVQAEFQKSLAKLQKAAFEVTALIGRERGYTLVLEKNTLPVLFAAESINITPEVIGRLNAKAKAPAGPSKSGGRR